jgi:hypothetical protein
MDASDGTTTSTCVPATGRLYGTRRKKKNVKTYSATTNENGKLYATSITTSA